ncbi:MAG: heme-binding protein [Planctomycetes bacterium]|nr:heme-binding protein [Planctomycetota bacterium]
MSRAAGLGLLFAVSGVLDAPLSAQGAATLEARLRAEPVKELAAAARRDGDPRRGAAVFFQPGLACSRCHATDAPAEPVAARLGPDLTQLGAAVDDVMLVEALLEPSRRIRPGFEPPEIEPGRPGRLSTMPAGQMAELASRQQFLDLVAFLAAARDGGRARVRELAPPPELRRLALPEYEGRLDHAGLIAALDDAALARGATIYQRVCANCHGTREQAGSLPNAPRFGTTPLKNGSDPLALYRTLTHGFGAMAPQAWMVPAQKYDVVHYLREALLRPFAPAEYVAVDRTYLAALPPGDTRGPAPAALEPWMAMDWGASFAHVVEVPGGAAPNFAYKGLTVRLDPGAGGVARGSHWLLYDLDTLRVAAAWSADESSTARFLDWRGIQLDGEHAIHPKLVGMVAFANPNGPGVARPGSSSFFDDARVVGRDGRRYGPLPREWARLRGVHHLGTERVLDYSVGATRVLELPALAIGGPGAPTRFVRHLEIGPRAEPLRLRVATLDATATIEPLAEGSGVRFGPPAQAASSGDGPRALPFAGFDGSAWLERPLPVRATNVPFTNDDFTLAVRMRTRHDGAIAAVVTSGPSWTPNGQALFVRDGLLCFDIGWVGCVNSTARVDDGAWHEIAARWRRSDGRLELWIDGRLDAHDVLEPQAPLNEAVLRLGYGAPDFPENSAFRGELAALRIDGAAVGPPPPARERTPTTLEQLDVAAAVGKTPLPSGWRRAGDAGAGVSPRAAPAVVASFTPAEAPLSWRAEGGGLLLEVAAGPAPLRFALWCEGESAGATAQLPVVRDLAALVEAPPRRTEEAVITAVQRGASNGPFAVDVLTLPDTNPWLALVRPSGLDFLPDGRLALCTWDGDVWLARLLDDDRIEWRRFATGLHQPLGLKVVDGLVHLTCRDQLAVLHDRNGDDQVDFIECRNGDHQVTEHFHEFAMGLQVDANGDFLYAKSGRHALPAVVPQHGTVLRVRRDGSATDVVACGLRAANGIAVLPDGAMVVTDQEGFWTPKNRINWIPPGSGEPPRFYGNLLGWHDGVSADDAAMEPPLCWLTNEFDRSPAEALPVPAGRFGELGGQLLCTSYGEGRLFLVLHEAVEVAAPGGGAGSGERATRSLRQGAALALPGLAFPTGVMRARFAPDRDELFACGMFAWAGDATQPGGLYRIRRTAAPLQLPLALTATATGLRLTFSSPLAPATVTPAAFTVKRWSLRRSAEYGSPHVEERRVPTVAARLLADGRTVDLELPGLAPTWCYELRYVLTAADGGEVAGTLHGTLHGTPPGTAPAPGR